MTTPKNGLPAIHPGEFLAEILGEYHLSQAALARAIGVSAMRVNHVIAGTRSINAEMAHLLGKATGTTPQYWLNLQATYDLKTLDKDVQRRAVQKLVAA